MARRVCGLTFRVVDLGTAVKVARAEGLVGCVTSVAEGPAVEGSHVRSTRDSSH